MGNKRDLPFDATEALRLRAQGLTVNEIAERMNVQHLSPLKTLLRGVRRGPRKTPLRQQKIDREEARRLRLEGWSLEQIGQRFGASREGVRLVVGDLPIPDRGPSPEIVAEARRLRGENWSFSRIADHLDLSVPSVRGITHDIPLRSLKEQHEDEVIRLYFTEKLRQADIADRLGISQSQVSQIVVGERTRRGTITGGRTRPYRHHRAADSGGLREKFIVMEARRLYQQEWSIKDISLFLRITMYETTVIVGDIIDHQKRVKKRDIFMTKVRKLEIAAEESRLIRERRAGNIMNNDS